MKIFLEFTKNDYKEHGYYEFKILSCCSPSNLWLVVDNGINKDEGVVTHDFQYRKVISLMEVSTRIQAGIELHGQVVTIAWVNYGHLYNIVLNLGEDYPNFIWHQTENFINDGDASLSMTQHVLSLVSTHFKNRICWSQLVKQYQGFASGLKKHIPNKVY